MTESNAKRIEQMDRDELHDLIQILNKKIQRSVHLGTKNFRESMTADERKEKAKSRLMELEDWSGQKNEKSLFSRGY